MPSSTPPRSSEMGVFSTGDERATVSVTVTHSILPGPAASPPLRRCNDQTEGHLRSVLGGVLQQALRGIPANARGSAALLQRGRRLLRADPPCGRGSSVQGL